MVVSGTQRKGDTAKSRAIASFTALELDVFVPISEASRYDLIVDTGSGLFRVQTKFSKSRDVDLRRIHSNSTGYVMKKYGDGDFDWLYVLSEDSKEYLISGIQWNRSYVRTQDKYLLSNWKVPVCGDQPALNTGMAE